MSYRDLFQRLNQDRIRYVVPRRYDSLPDETIRDGGDVDLLIESNRFSEGIELCESLGFEAEPAGTSRFRLYRRALTKPMKAVGIARDDPRGAIRKIITGQGGEFTNPRHKNKQLHRDSEMVDLINNLAYTSPMDGSKVPVDPSVTEGMLKRRQAEGCFFVPTPADELAHLIPHCVFDKEGTFSPYYANRCETLYDVVRDDMEQHQLFQRLLANIFYKADQLVYELVEANRFEDIRSELKQFSGY